MKLATLFPLAPAALCLVACGDPLMTKHDRGDVVRFRSRGRINCAF